jgi:hypothetical protein
VLLDPHVVPLARNLDDLGRPMTLRIVAAGRDHGDVSAIEIAVTPQATALRPLAPVHISARRSGDGVHIAWVRRTRIDGDGWEAADVPLGEAAEAYAVDILDGGEVVRTMNTASPSALYTVADEMTDFGAPQINLNIRIAQLSATVGRGIAAEVMLTL